MIYDRLRDSLPPFLRRYILHFETAIDDAVRDFASSLQKDASILDAYLRCASATTVKKDLAAPRFPVLVLAGGRDRVIPPEASRRLWERFDGAAFELLDEAGHYLPMTHADWFNERLRQHLEVTV